MSFENLVSIEITSEDLDRIRSAPCLATQTLEVPVQDGLEVGNTVIFTAGHESMPAMADLTHVQAHDGHVLLSFVVTAMGVAYNAATVDMQPVTGEDEGAAFEDVSPEIEGARIILDPPERSRTYEYVTTDDNGRPAVFGITLFDVRDVVVRPSGTHRVRTGDGHLHVMAAGWVHIEIDADDWQA